jgi:hypothetical protein
VTAATGDALGQLFGIAGNGATVQTPPAIPATEARSAASEVKPSWDQITKTVGGVTTLSRDVSMLMPSTRAAYPQVISSHLASFRGAKPHVFAVHSDF